MASYKLPNGQPLPVDQYAKWQRSVHAASMFDKEDLSAPTCNDCHGNHGAVPPGVESVGFVCGQCHGREAALFAASPKHEGFQRHNEYLAQVGAEGCAGCHDASEPQAAMTSVRGFTECATCHGNHAIIRPTVGLLGPLPETPCAFCHESSAAAGDRRSRARKGASSLRGSCATNSSPKPSRKTWTATRGSTGWCGARACFLPTPSRGRGRKAPRRSRAPSSRDSSRSSASEKPRSPSPIPPPARKCARA